MKARLMILALLGSLMLAQSAVAKTLYIHDNLRVDMRSGPGTEYRILDFLRSGTRMEQLQESGEWIKVRIADKEGWVQLQYTTPELIARDQLERALKEIDRLKTDNKSLSEQLTSARSELATLKSNYEKVSGSTTDLQKELNRVTQVHRSAITTETAYRQLQEESELLKVDMEKMKVENVRLREDKLAEGIKWGAGAVLLGVILAWLISKSSGKKRRSEW